MGLTVDVETPECDRMLAVRDKSQAIGEFLEWAADGGYSIGKVTRGRNWAGQIVPGHFVTIEATSIKQLLAEFFSIDLELVEREKLALLAEIRDAAAG